MTHHTLFRCDMSMIIRLSLQLYKSIEFQCSSSTVSQHRYVKRSMQNEIVSRQTPGDPQDPGIQHVWTGGNKYHCSHGNNTLHTYQGHS